MSSNGATLIAADHTGNMTLQPDSIVTEIIFDPKLNKATGVRVQDAHTKTTTEYYAKVIFLCASTLNSTWLMLNSKSDRFPNGFGNDSDELGRNVMDHHLGVGAQADVEGHEDRYYSGRRPNGIYIPRFRNIADSRSKRNDFTRGYATLALKLVLAEAGAGFEHVYAMTTYHVGIHEQLETFIRIKDRYMLRENPPPAWTGIGVTALSFPGQIVEIQVNAYVPE
jgi:choline dehydrogenase-like flavoprotein